MGFWTDWLDPNDNGKHEGKGKYKLAAPQGSDARSKLDKLCGVPYPSTHYCNGCQRETKRCNCDKELGRPRKWWE